MREEFPIKTQQVLAQRAGLRCSREGCDQPTAGPQVDPSKALNVGVAAHITAASPRGPRYDPTLTTSQRRSVENGIWLCQTCAKLVDNDPSRYTVSILQSWKRQAEALAVARLEHRTEDSTVASPFIRLEGLIPGLLREMAADLRKDPLIREFVLLKKRWSYWGKEDEFVYYYDDHPQLDAMVRILANHGMIHDITHTNVARYVISEDLVDYLRCRPA